MVPTDEQHRVAHSGGQDRRGILLEGPAHGVAIPPGQNATLDFDPEQCLTGLLPYRALADDVARINQESGCPIGVRQGPSGLCRVTQHGHVDESCGIGQRLDACSLEAGVDHTSNAVARHP
jgi:hypothetical protein